MGVWKVIHFAIDPKGAAELEKRHASRRAPEPGILSSWFAGRRANRASDQYWEDARVIGNASTPLSHLTGNDLGHRPGCPCWYCSRERG